MKLKKAALTLLFTATTTQPFSSSIRDFPCLHFGVVLLDALTKLPYGLAIGATAYSGIHFLGVAPYRKGILGITKAGAASIGSFAASYYLVKPLISSYKKNDASEQ